LNDEVASLNAKLKTCKNDFDKLKFARDAYTIGRHPSIKDGLGFRKETKNLTSEKAPVLNKEKGKAPMASSLKNIMLTFMIENFLGMLIIIGVMMRLIHMLCFLLALLLCMVEVGLEKIMLCLMCLGEHVMNLPPFTKLATLHLRFYVKMKR
jgi:hypothetical protein